MKQLIFSLAIAFTLFLFSSCTRTANRTGPLKPYPPITSDIEIGEQISGEGTRAELLGFIRWGDPGRASFRAHPQENDLGGGVVKQSMQSAVYKALDGKADQFIVDPHFHVVEHNFLVFKTSKAKVVGRRASNKNYRQVKRFNTDQTETLELTRSPQTYTVFRNGKEATKIVTSGNITSHVTDTAKVYDTSAGVKALDLDMPANDDSNSLDDLRQKMGELNRRLEALDR
jgi:hypothetical protein